MWAESFFIWRNLSFASQNFWILILYIADECSLICYLDQSCSQDASSQAIWNEVLDTTSLAANKMYANIYKSKYINQNITIILISSSNYTYFVYKFGLLDLHPNLDFTTLTILPKKFQQYLTVSSETRKI